MKNLTTTEMNLTDREIHQIAFEAQGVNPYDPHFMDELSLKGQRLLFKASTITFCPSFILRKCYYLVNGVKLAS